MVFFGYRKWASHWSKHLHIALMTLDLIKMPCKAQNSGQPKPVYKDTVIIGKIINFFLTFLIPKYCPCRERAVGHISFIHAVWKRALLLWSLRRRPSSCQNVSGARRSHRIARPATALRRKLSLLFITSSPSDKKYGSTLPTN